MSEATADGQGKTNEQTPQIGLAAQRREIIDSILTIGLRSSTSLKEAGVQHLPSADKEFDLVEGCVLKPSPDYPDAESRRAAIDEAFYIGDRSFFPVLIERAIDMAGLDNFYSFKHQGRYTRMIAQEKAVAEQRIRSSMIVVYKFNDDQREDELPTQFMDEDTLTAEEIAYVIIPREIYSEYTAGGGKKLNSIPILVVDRSIKRKILKLRNNTFQVPDYEQALTEVVNKLGSQIWAHAVRLPTSDDLVWEERWKKDKEELGF